MSSDCDMSIGALAVESSPVLSRGGRHAVVSCMSDVSEAGGSYASVNCISDPSEATDAFSAGIEAAVVSIDMSLDEPEAYERSLSVRVGVA